MASKYIKEVDMGFARLRKELRKNNKMNVKVGYFEKVHKDSGITVAGLASIHALGVPKVGIPKRDWIKPALIKNASMLNAQRRRLATEALEGTRTFESAVFEFGEFGRTAITQGLIALKHPKRKRETEKTKGKGLLRITGTLMRSAETRVLVRGKIVKRSRTSAIG